MGWDYNKYEEEMEERNHQFAVSFQKARKEAQIDEFIKNSGLYSLASEDGKAQLSFFPPIEKQQGNKMGQKEKVNNEFEEIENGI